MSRRSDSSRHSRSPHGPRPKALSDSAQLGLAILQFAVDPVQREHRHVRLPPDSQASDAVGPAYGPGRFNGGSPNDFRQRQTQVEQLGHDRRQVVGRSFAGSAVKIAADGVGPKPLLKTQLGNRPVERSLPEPHVEQHAPFPGRSDRGIQPPVRTDDGAAKSMVGVGINVARGHFARTVFQTHRRERVVDHQGKPDRTSRGQGPAIGFGLVASLIGQ